MEQGKLSIELDGQSFIAPSQTTRRMVVEPDMVPDTDVRAAVGQLLLTLDIARQRFLRNAPTHGTVEQLARELHRMRRSVSPDLWQRLIPVAQDHAIMQFLSQDPLTNWSFSKPRGYSGDASLLDIYYRHASAQHLLADCTRLGREIYDYTSEVPACAAGRERCRILAETVDRVADASDAPIDVLAVAAGHLREAEICHSLGNGRIARWVALDQDPVSVATMKANLAGTAVLPMEGSILGLLRRSYALGSFDLVYVSGLYDYLSQKTGVKLLQRLMELLKPGATLLLANFSDEITSDGYMETFMDWPLILRSAEDMKAIVNGAVDRNAVDMDIWYGSNRNIVYATLTRR